MDQPIGRERNKSRISGLVEMQYDTARNLVKQGNSCYTPGRKISSTKPQNAGARVRIGTVLIGGRDRGSPKGSLRRLDNITGTAAIGQYNRRNYGGDTVVNETICTVGLRAVIQ